MKMPAVRIWVAFEAVHNESTKRRGSQESYTNSAWDHGTNTNVADYIVAVHQWECIHTESTAGEAMCTTHVMLLAAE